MNISLNYTIPVVYYIQIGTVLKVDVIQQMISIQEAKGGEEAKQLIMTTTLLRSKSNQVTPQPTGSCAQHRMILLVASKKHYKVMPKY